MVLLAGWTRRTGTDAVGAGIGRHHAGAARRRCAAFVRRWSRWRPPGRGVQLALGRLQLQEQRINTAIKRADDARTRLAELQREQGRDAAADAGVGERAARARHRVGGDGPNPEEIAGMIEHHKQQLASHSAELQRVAAEEAAYATEVTTEQARWTEINQRLEELERALRPLK